MYMTFTFLSVASVGPKSALLGEYKCIQRLSMMTSCYIHSSLFIILLHCTYIYIETKYCSQQKLSINENVKEYI